MCQSSSAAHSRPFEISHSRKTVEFFHPKAAIIHAHSAKPILNQNNQTNLTRYVSLSRVLLLPYTVAYGNSIPEETNARFAFLEDSGSCFFPTARSAPCRFVAPTSCDLLIFFARNFVKFVKCVYSRGPCVRGGLRERGERGGCGRVWAW